MERIPETAYLAKDAARYLVTGTLRAGQAKSAYNSGKALGEEINTGAKEIKLGALCIAGTVATTMASFIAGGIRKGEYNTGKALRQELTESKEPHEELSSNFKP